MSPSLIVITGHPGTGKTTLAHRLSAELKFPLLCKDEIKEILFDRLGWSDDVWSRKLSLSAYGIMDYVLQSALSVGAGLIVESNFVAEYDSERFGGLIAKYDVRAMQIVLHCKEIIRTERFKNRGVSGNRHPGHHDLDKAQEHLEGERRTPLALDIPLIEIDTTDFENLDYKKLLCEIREACFESNLTV